MLGERNAAEALDRDRVGATDRRRGGSPFVDSATRRWRLRCRPALLLGSHVRLAEEPCRVRRCGSEGSSSSCGWIASAAPPTVPGAIEEPLAPLVALGAELAAAGVRHELVIWPGLAHGTLATSRALDAAPVALERSGGRIRTLLAEEPP